MTTGMKLSGQAILLSALHSYGPLLSLGELFFSRGCLCLTECACFHPSGEPYFFIFITFRIITRFTKDIFYVPLHTYAWLLGEPSVDGYHVTCDRESRQGIVSRGRAGITPFRHVLEPGRFRYPAALERGAPHPAKIALHFSQIGVSFVTYMTAPRFPSADPAFERCES